MRKKNLKVDLIAENVHIDFVVISLFPEWKNIHL